MLRSLRRPNHPPKDSAVEKVYAQCVSPGVHELSNVVIYITSRYETKGDRYDYLVMYGMLASEWLNAGYSFV